MPIALVQSAEAHAAGSAPVVTLGAPPAPGHLLVLGVACQAASQLETIPFPAGWSPASALMRITFDNEWAGRLFWKLSAGPADQSIVSPAVGADNGGLILAEFSKGGVLVAQAHGNRTHSSPSLFGNRAADGFPAMAAGDGHELLFVAWWYRSSAVNSVENWTVDQAAPAAIVAHTPSISGIQAANAMAMLPVALSAGGYRLTGVGQSNDNFPAWAMAAFQPTRSQAMPPGYW